MNIYERIAQLEAKKRELLTAPIKLYQVTPAAKRRATMYFRDAMKYTSVIGPLGWTPPGLRK